MNDALILKNRLKEARAERGLSQSELARMVGGENLTPTALQNADEMLRLAGN